MQPVSALRTGVKGGSSSVLRLPGTWILLLASLALAGGAASLGGCSSTIENRDPSGERFPSVEATSLTGDPVLIPEDFAGAPVLLLVGYVQGSQFDIDRWLYGALDAELEVALREVPAARGAAAQKDLALSQAAPDKVHRLEQEIEAFKGAAETGCQLFGLLLRTVGLCMKQRIFQEM